MHDDEINGALSEQLDTSGEKINVLTLGEARAARYDLWLFGQGDGPPGFRVGAGAGFASRSAVAADVP